MAKRENYRYSNSMFHCFTIEALWQIIENYRFSNSTCGRDHDDFVQNCMPCGLLLFSSPCQSSSRLNKTLANRMLLCAVERVLLPALTDGSLNAFQEHASLDKRLVV